MGKRKVDVAIIGAGTAGLYAFRQVKKHTDSVVLINGGPYGTTCARTGCMPSKAFIQAAHDFHKRVSFENTGIIGAEHLSVDSARVLAYVRNLRDGFVAGVLKNVEKVGEHNIAGYARFTGPDELEVNGSFIKADKIIIATGSYPFFPSEWKTCHGSLLTTDDFFEMDKLPSSMAVLGGGIIGLELGQALCRLGVATVVIEMGEYIAGLSDPVVNKTAVEIFSDEFRLMCGHKADLVTCDGRLKINTGTDTIVVDKALVALGRRPNIQNLSLENIGVELDSRGLPLLDEGTLRIKGTNIYMAGDANALRPVMHEAADDGRIAGYNASVNADKCFKRRENLAVTFSDPQISLAGKRYADLSPDSVAIGQSLTSENGRARIKGYDKGIIRVYADKKTGLLLGSEMAGPDSDFIGHVMAWLIQSQATVFDVLQMPFYHPTLMENLRSAMYDLASNIEVKTSDMELSCCECVSGRCFN